MARWWFNGYAGPKSPKAIAKLIVVGKPVVSQHAPAARLFDCVCERCKLPFKSLKKNRRFHSTGCGVLLGKEKHVLTSAPRLRFMPPRVDFVERRVEQRRSGKAWDCTCEGACIWERRVLDRRDKKRRNTRAVRIAVYDPVSGRKSWQRVAVVPDVGAITKKPCFKPSTKAARELRDKDASPFRK